MVRQRRVTQFVVLASVLALATGIIIAAVQADGRTETRTSTNDGGAWLIRRSTGVVGHLNRATGEVTGTIGVSTMAAEFDVEQAAGSVVVNDRSSSKVSVIDPRNFQVVNSTTVPADAHVALVTAGAVVWTDNPLRVWRLNIADLTDRESLDGVEPLTEADGPGFVTATTGDTVWVVDIAGRRAGSVEPDAAVIKWIDLGDAAEGVRAISSVGEALIIADDTEAALVIDAGGGQHRIEGVPTGAALAVPAPEGAPLVAVAVDGSIVRAELDDVSASVVGAGGGTTPVQPIFYDGCVFAAVTGPPTFTRTCAEGTDQTVALEGSNGAALRLRLVNGWIWVNDLDTGALWVTTTEGPLDRIDDWGADLSSSDGGDSESDDLGSSTEQRDNPDSNDASFQQADQIDEDGINEPPVARDDVARTRADRAVVVDVLANDDDPDGDVLLITSVTGQPADSLVTPTADRTAVQVQPPPGFIGDIAFTYEISDGRGGTSSAAVVVQVSPNDGSNNRPPTPVTDVAEARAGSSASLNALTNDSDPDGDTLILQSVTAETGAAVFDPSGEISFTPDPSSGDGTASASYVVADTFGATATGTIRIEIRLDGSNNEPDARNDSAVTVVGKPVTLNVLANDTDPDNDPLSVAGPPIVLIPEDAELSALTVSLSPDGEFFFSPTAAGSFLFRYSVIDGSENDSAIIRVDVEVATENRPPIAIRDDVTISQGGTETVYMMQNDADPDGDVIALTGWTGAAGLEIEEVQGIGFRITAAVDAASQISFRYSISDGGSDPVSATVVVSVSSIASVDQAPVARPDILDVRPGRTTAVQVLINDFDPEGTPIRVAAVASAPSATLRIGPGAQDIFVSVAADAITGFSFGYDIVDEAGNRSASFVQVRLVPDGEANRPPIARSDISRTRSGQAITIDVLANDSDPDGDAIRLESIAAQPAFGVATPNPDGTLTYTAASDHSGTDRLRYVVVDAYGDRSIGEVLIGIMPPGTDNLEPTAADDAFTVVAGADPIALDVLANDFDSDGDRLTVTRAIGSTAGSAAGSVGGGAAEVEIDQERRHLIFSPPASITGDSATRTVQYSISDGRGGTDDATVTIEILSSVVPIAPVAVDDVIGPIRPGQTVSYDLLANDLDPDGARAALVPTSADPAIVFAAGVPAGVTPDVTANFTANFTANVTAGAATTEHLYTITDADGLTATALVTVIVADNLAPVLATIAVETTTGQPVAIDIGSQIADPDADPLFFVCCDGVRHGTAATTASAAGVLTLDFAPDTGFAGVAGFSYTADDQNGHVVAGAVVVTVIAPANSPPTAIDATGSVEAGTVGSVALAGFVTDPDLATGDQLTFELLDAPASATLAGDTIVVEAPIEAGGTVLAARYRATDSAGAVAEAAVTITITPSAAPPPTAVADAADTTQGVAVSLDAVANDVDPIGRGLLVVAAGGADGSGSVTVGGDGRTITFSPRPDFFGTAQLTYTVQDARGPDGGQGVGQISIGVVGLPGKPATPQATASNGTAAVTWGQGAANGSPVDDVEIMSDLLPARSIGVVSSYTYIGLPNGVAQSFRVRAHNAAGWGEWSEPSAAVTPDTQPGRPASPAVVFADGALSVSWTAPANEGSAVTGYQLEIGGGQTTLQTLGNVLNYTWTGLNNGTNYQLRVVAVNAAGPSEPSAWSAPEHPLREPGAPGVPAVVQGDRSLDLRWAQPADNGDPVIEYQVERQSNAGVFVPATATTMRWSDLPNGVPQQFRVRARNRDADWGAVSGWSAPVTPCGVPDTPAAPGAVRGDQTATVTWTAAGDQGCAITQYQVETNTGLNQGAGASPHAFTGLSNGTSYSFRVRAQNSVGWGGWSAMSGAVTPAGVPTAPSSMTATPVAPGTVDLGWGAASANGAPIADYQISVNDGAPRGVGAVTSYRYSGLGNGTSYSFKARACNDVGCGAWSGSRSTTTWGEPAQVGTPSASAGNATMTANWSAPAANGSAITSYNVELDPGGVTSNPDRSRAWSGLNNGTTYRVRVQACNAVGCGGWSGWASATPTSPVSVTISKDGSAVGQPGCATSGCAWVATRATGLTPNTAYVVECHGNGLNFSASTVSSNGSGVLNDRSCYYGYTNTDFWVTVGPHRSNTIRW